LNSISKPRGHKEGRASFPTKIQYKVFTIPWLKSYLEERKEEEHGGRRTPWRKEREGAYSIFYLYVVSARARAGAPLPFSLVSCCLASLSFLSKSPTKD